MCHLQRIPFAPNLVLQQVAPPYGLNSLQLAAETLGLKAGVKHAAVAELAHLPLPCLAVLKPASVPHPIEAANQTIAPSAGQAEMKSKRRCMSSSIKTNADQRTRGRGQKWLNQVKNKNQNPLA
jgi:hypothetical protein